MPIFFQQQINPGTRLGIWKIEETETFFRDSVPVHRDVTHPHKRLQHLAGRFLLQFLFPAFPYEMIQLADTRKPFLPSEQFHFSISHCGDYAAAIVSRETRAGIDVEIPIGKIARIREKFLSPEEIEQFGVGAGHPENLRLLTTLWSAKEAVYKWYGEGKVDFSEQIRLQGIDEEQRIIRCFFTKTNSSLRIHYGSFDNLVLAWVIDEAITG
ncbi:MAG: 4'-phosphopantetheinyl transferase superfamily protein [Chitinophagaceae bacterium]|nr:MAG: 4'-phosphopantetheinyl transferase superfamily protein [Chitinophagaceae bacterium]